MHKGINTTVDEGQTPVVAHSLNASRSSTQCPNEDTTLVPVPTTMQVRRLTPRECERLQGFPDDYTQIPFRNKPAADGPRYKALGNSMAVNVMAFIGQRIQEATK
jgi:site-specific DNA-cytosine methylase